MNVLIVEDDINFANKLRNEFQTFFQDAISSIKFDIVTNNYDNYDYSFYDIAFLDIQLNDFSGIEVGKRLRMNYPNILLVYVSIRDDLVFDSLSTGVFQFIRKNNYEFDRNIVFNQLRDQFIKQQVRFLVINKRKELIKMNHIKYIIALGKEIIISGEEDYVMRSSLKDILEELDYRYLVQISRNTIINCNFIEKIQLNKVYTLDKKEYVVGRKYLLNLQKIYEEYLLLWYY